jgi:AcrR family transcriptional regulator
VVRLRSMMRERLVPKSRVEDRRVRRTRALLQDALMSLMVEKGYEAITVQEIIDRADVGRATFYAHFADKRTLLVSRLEDLRASLIERQRETLARGGVSGSARTFGFSRAMLEHAADGLPLWRAIARAESGAFVLRRVHEMLADLVRTDLATLGMTRASAQREMLTQQVTGAFIAVMTWWLDAGAKLPVDEVDQLFCRAVMNGLPSLIRSSDSSRSRHPVDA